ncbi:MAG: hypothetical protein ACFFBP_00885 [Promethearchaeota archaeon]
MVIQEEIKKILTTCPICKSKKELKVPDSIINDASQLTTVSLPKGLICDHHFQVFIDKNFKVRGYQKVDFEIKLGKIEKKNSEIKYIDFEINEEKNLFRNLLIDGNYLEYQPKNLHTTPIDLKKQEKSSKKHVMTLEEIYEEFWQFIDDNNPEFEEYIFKDKRRVKVA